MYAYIRTDPRWPLPRPWSPEFKERVHYLPRFFPTHFWSHHHCRICLIHWAMWDSGKCYENSYGAICESKHSNIRMCEAMLSRCILSEYHIPPCHIPLVYMAYKIILIKCILWVYLSELIMLGWLHRKQTNTVTDRHGNMFNLSYFWRKTMRLQSHKILK